MVLPEWFECSGCLKSLVLSTGSLAAAIQMTVAMIAVTVVLKQGKGAARAKWHSLLIVAGSLVALILAVTSLYASAHLAKIQQAQIQALTEATQPQGQGD